MRAKAGKMDEIPKSEWVTSITLRMAKKKKKHFKTLAMSWNNVL